MVREQQKQPGVKLAFCRCGKVRTAKKIKWADPPPDRDAQRHDLWVALELAVKPTTAREPDPVRLPMLGCDSGFSSESNTYDTHASSVPTHRYERLFKRVYAMTEERKGPSRGKKLHRRERGITDGDFLRQCKEYLSMKDMCDLFQVHYMTIHRWERFEKIPPGMRLGRKIYWKREEITALMDSLESHQREAKRKE